MTDRNWYLTVPSLQNSNIQQVWSSQYCRRYFVSTTPLDGADTDAIHLSSSVVMTGGKVPLGNYCGVIESPVELLDSRQQHAAGEPVTSTTE